MDQGCTNNNQKKKEEEKKKGKQKLKCVAISHQILYHIITIIEMRELIQGNNDFGFFIYANYGGIVNS